MKRLLWIAAGAALVGASFTCALEGCGGGDDASTSGPNDGGGGSDSTVGSDDGGNVGNDGGTPIGDGGSTTDSGGGGPVSNPGEATCGPVLTCNVDAGNGGGAAGKPYCCERPDGGDSCETNNAACGATGTRLECDEPADCPANKDECCLTTNTFGSAAGDGGITVGTSACNNNCGKNDLVLCKSTKDCGDAGTCALRTCKGGDTFYACNTNDDCK
jgi:hypothetical protein